MEIDRGIDGVRRMVDRAFAIDDPTEAVELVRRLDADDDPDGLLHMLAAGRTATGVEAFRRLGEPRSRLSHAGGWEFTPSGDVRVLTSDVMPFVGMITGGDLWIDAGQCCFYLFHDPGCGLSAVVYQQS